MEPVELVEPAAVAASVRASLPGEALLAAALSEAAAMETASSSSRRGVTRERAAAVDVGRDSIPVVAALAERGAVGYCEAEFRNDAVDRPASYG